MYYNIQYTMDKNNDESNKLLFKNSKEILEYVIFTYSCSKKLNIKDITKISDVTKNITNVKKQTEYKENFETINNFAPNAQINYFISDKITDLQASIITNEINIKTLDIYVVFRGSESFFDLIYDIQTIKIVLRDNIKVHNGFHKQLFLNGAYQKIHDELNKILETNKNKHCNIHITGHSLGGSLAILFGYLYATETNKNITIVTFASPRVGNIDFQKNFNSMKNIKMYRIENDKDIITTMPFFKYYHVGTQVILYDNKICVNKTEQIDNYTIFHKNNVGEHRCAVYKKRLSFA